MDTADLRVVSSKQYCSEHPPLKIFYGISSRVSGYVGKNSLLLLYRQSEAFLFQLRE